MDDTRLKTVLGGKYFSENMLCVFFIYICFFISGVATGICV